MAARHLPRCHPAGPTGRVDRRRLARLRLPGRLGTIGLDLVAGAGSWPIAVAVPELGFSATLTGPEDLGELSVGPVEPWTAESPRLYEATIASRGERITLPIGFRTVHIVDGQLLVNDRPVTFRGMNRHETHPIRGRVFDAEHARADLIMMKRHGVNAVRTSHYPPHPAVLALTDELGFWVIDECDLETHGFEYQGWAGNPSDDPVMQRCFSTGSGGPSSGTRTIRA